MSETMMTPVVKLPTDYTIYRSGVCDSRGDQYVIACGYSTNGKYGYFIVGEKVHNGTVHYTTHYEFIPKTSEKSYQQALNILKEIVARENQ